MARLATSYLVCIVIYFFPINCHAYIDPNAGGFLFQLLFPLVIAVVGAWTVFRQRIGAVLNRLRRRSSKNAG